MVKMTPDQEPAHAPDFGAAQGDLPQGAPLADDRPVEQGTGARITAPVTQRALGPLRYVTIPEPAAVA
jgi:hypothetical protein